MLWRGDPVLAVLAMRFMPTVSSGQSVAEMDTAFDAAKDEMRDMLEQAEALKAKKNEDEAKTKAGDDAGFKG